LIWAIGRVLIGLNRSMSLLVLDTPAGSMVSSLFGHN
jgi:hypothetical protein